MAEGPAQRILVTRHCDDVDMIGHQAIGPHLYPMPRRRLGQQIEIQRVVRVLKERPLAPVATLGDMVGNAGQDHAGKTRHLRGLACLPSRVNLGVYGRVTVMTVMVMPRNATVMRTAGDNAPVTVIP